MKNSLYYRLFSVINMLLITFLCAAQKIHNSVLEDFLENISVDNSVEEFDLTDYIEELNTYIEHPLNLNTATRFELRKFPFLSEKQIENLQAYIYINHQMKSIYELQLVQGFDVYTIKNLLPFVTVEVINTSVDKSFKTMLKNSLKYGKSKVLTSLYIPFYNRKGFQQTYKGLPVYNSLRYAFNYGRKLYIGFTAEQDFGEPFASFVNPAGYDYYSFYFLFKEVKPFNVFCVGNYRLNYGQGLCLGSSFLSGKQTFIPLFDRRVKGIKKHSSTSESNYFQGLAADISLNKRCDLSLFYSYRLVDAAFRNDTITSLPKTGLHRTISEMNKKRRAALQLIGCHFNYCRNRFQLGTTAIYYWFNHIYHPRLSGYRKYNLWGSKFYNIGVDYSYHFSRFSIQGETSLGTKGYATLNTLRYTFKNDSKLMLIQRLYSYNYWSLFASGFSDGGHIQNESGWYLASENFLFPKVKLFCALDLFSFPWKKFRISKPSEGLNTIMQLDYTPRRNLKMYCRYRFKKKDRDLISKKSRFTLPTYHHQLRYQLTYLIKEKIKLKSTIDYTTFYYSQHPVDRGFLFTQYFQYDLMNIPLSLSFQGGYFNTDSFDTRVYSFERGLLNKWYIPSFSGEGYRLSGYLRYDLNPHWTFIVKYLETIYCDRLQIGSGNDLILGNKKGDLQMQLCIKF